MSKILLEWEVAVSFRSCSQRRGKFTTSKIFTLSGYFMKLLLKEEPYVNDVENLRMFEAFRMRNGSGMLK